MESKNKIWNRMMGIVWEVSYALALMLAAAVICVIVLLVKI